MNRHLLLPLLAVSLSFSNFAFANDDDFGGFDEEVLQQPGNVEPTAKEVVKDSIFEMDGSLGLSSWYNINRSAPKNGESDYREFTSLRSSIDLGVELDLPKSWKSRFEVSGFYDLIYSLRGHDNYSAETLDELESELEIDEAYVTGKLSKNIDLKIGRQVVIWGKSDNLRVTDILNPIDNRAPGMTDIKDLVLPVVMAKIDYYTGPINVSLIAIPERRFNKTPPAGGEYYPAPFPLKEGEEESISLSDMGYAASINGLFTGYDFSIYAASTHSTVGHIKRDESSSSFFRNYEPIKMVGAAFNIVSGAWLYKIETARLSGLRFFADEVERSRFDLLAGVEYYGITDSNLGFEIVNRHLFDHNAAIENVPDDRNEDEIEMAFRYTSSFMHDKLNVTAVFLLFGLEGAGGSIQRAQAEYEIAEATIVTAGFTLYQTGEKFFFRKLDDNDKFFIMLDRYF